jgi:hypothetical protein
MQSIDGQSSSNFTVMFCKGFQAKFKKFYKSLGTALIENANIALKVTTVIKSFLEGPVVSTAVLLTATKLDDEIREKVLKALTLGINALGIVNTCKHEIALDAKLLCFIQELRKVAPELQQAILIKLAAIITAHLDGAKEKQSVYDTLVQGTYSFNK